MCVVFLLLRESSFPTSHTIKDLLVCKMQIVMKKEGGREDEGFIHPLLSALTNSP
jgi:hypothetical protein